MGHIEDIVVNKDQQGKKLGLRIIEALDYIAEKVGCYKVSSLGSHYASKAIMSPHSLSLSLYRYQTPLYPLKLTPSISSSQTILDCSETNEGFYVKCGYKRVGLEMAHYYDHK